MVVLIFAEGWCKYGKIMMCGFGTETHAFDYAVMRMTLLHGGV